MRHKILHIDNFGPVNDAAVELRTINMFIGEQSIGKSTIAKLITIFTDYISLCKLVQGGVPMWELLLKEYGLDIYKDYPYHITYDMEQDNDTDHEAGSFHLEIIRGKIKCYMTEGGKMITNRKSIINKIICLKRIYHSEAVKKITSGIRNEDILELLTNSLYVPAERIIYSVITNLWAALNLADSSVPKNLLRFMVELNNAKSEYPDFQIRLLDASFTHKGTEDYIVIDPHKTPIPMKAASSGIQSLVPLLLVLHYAINKREYSSFVIEEPECNLFPTKQVELLKEILKVARYPYRTLTITTHSPYMLSAMNNILFAGMLIEKYGEGLKEYISQIIPEESLISVSECSVYSLGADINDGVYCRSLLDEETGMIDFNSLDQVSEEMSDEFDALQRAAMKFAAAK